MNDGDYLQTAQLTPAEVAALLGATATVLQTEFAAMPEAMLRWRPTSDSWSVLDVVGHLTEAEQRGFAGRVCQIVTESRPRFQGWDPSEVARIRNDTARGPQAVLDEFLTLRAASVELVASLTASDLGRGGDHPDVGFLTVADLLHEWVQHDAAHLTQMRDNMQGYVWPHLGNARRFSQPEIEEIIIAAG